MKMWFRRIILRAMCFAITAPMIFAVATAEGSATVSAQALYSRSIGNFKAASSVYASVDAGTLTAKGTIASTTLLVTGSFFRSGDFSGSVTVDGFTSEVRVLNGEAYARENIGFLEKEAKLPKAEATKISKEWLRAPDSISDLATGSQTPELGMSLSFTSILRDFQQNFGSLRISGTSTINAVPSYVIRGIPGFALWVTQSSPYRPLDLALASAGKFMDFDLLNWNVGRPAGPPASSVPINSIKWPTALSGSGLSTS